MNRELAVFLTLTRETAKDGKINLAVIKSVMSKMIAKATYSNQFGATDIKSPDQAEYDFQKPKYKKVIATSTLLTGLKAGTIPKVFRADIVFKGKINEDLYIADLETGKTIVHDVSELDASGLGQLLVLNALATSLSWADYLNQRFILAIIRASAGRGGSKVDYAKASAPTASTFITNLKKLKRKFGGVYTTEALGISSNDIIYIINDAGSDLMDDFVLSSGNWKDGDNGTLIDMFRDKTGKWYFVDNRIQTFLTEGDTDLPCALAFVRGAIGQKVIIVDKYQLKPAGLVGMVEEHGRIKHGTIQLMTNQFFGAYGTTEAFAKLVTDKYAPVDIDDKEAIALDSDGKEYAVNKETTSVAP